MIAMLKLQRTGEPLRILVVTDGDDLEAIRAFPGKDRAGALVYVSSLAEAHDVVATEHIDAVLMDFGLARTSGRDFRGQLAASSLRIPMIVLLEDNAVVEANEAITMGADGFYYKSQLYPWLFGGQEDAPAG